MHDPAPLITTITNQSLIARKVLALLGVQRQHPVANGIMLTSIKTSVYGNYAPVPLTNNLVVKPVHLLSAAIHQRLSSPLGAVHFLDRAITQENGTHQTGRWEIPYRTSQSQTLSSRGPPDLIVEGLKDTVQHVVEIVTQALLVLPATSNLIDQAHPPPQHSQKYHEPGTQGKFRGPANGSARGTHCPWL